MIAINARMVTMIIIMGSLRLPIMTAIMAAITTMVAMMMPITPPKMVTTRKGMTLP